MNELLERLKATLTPGYSIERELRGNPIATAFLTEDLSEDRSVIVNVLRADVAASLDIDSFLERMKRVETLSHPHLVPVYGAGSTGGLVYYVTQHVEGVTVRDKLDVHGRAPLDQVARILRDVAVGLTEAHRQGILHLAVTPDHVLLRGHEAMLTDVGVAQAISAATAGGLLSFGALEYTAPEWASSSREGDTKTDIYQIGALGYELLTGQAPSRSMSAEPVFAGMEHDTPEPVSDKRADTPPSLAQLVMKCLAPAPADRWENLDQLLSDLALDESESAIATGMMDPIGAIGPYKIRGVLGRGGMGVVYSAEQTQPVRRQVALKVIKLGMDTKEVLARFDAERQALAVMDHPRIAKVHDAGTTTTGRPYFVMELVSGVPFTEFCDRERLSIHERLELFSQVCHAVQHAHQKGIIHRDLKPSNILVGFEDGRAVPKVIDFGLAKATGFQLTDRTLETRLDQLLGTPAYVSPEQTGVTNEDVDTRTDVYALGVMLYELLTGELPLDPDAFSSGSDDMRRAIRLTDPPKPSVRLQEGGDSQAAIAERRNTDPATLRRQLAGDLDWITMTAMEKDKARRYQTVTGLADDLQRHLRNEPVLARPPSTVYRIGKFVRRHKAGVATVAVATLGLLAALAVTTALLVRTTRAERLAAREAATAQQVSDFLESVFAVSDPSEALGDTITARELLDRGAEDIVEGLGEQPLVQARLMKVIGNVYMSLGLYDQAAGMLEKSLDLRMANLPEDDLEVAESVYALATLYDYQAQHDKSDPLFDRALAIREATLGEDHPDVARILSGMAASYIDRGRYADAEALLIRAMDIDSRALGPDHSDVLDIANNLGAVYYSLGRYAEAASVHLQTLAALKRSLGPEHPRIATTLSNLGNVYQEQGKLEEAAQYQEQALAMREKTLGPNHPDVSQSLNNLAMTYGRMERLDDARPLLERSLAIKEEALGPDHPSLATVLNNLALTYMFQGSLAEAESLYERSLSIQEAALGQDDPRLAAYLTNLGELYVRQGRHADALPLFRRAVAIDEKSLGPDHHYLGVDLMSLAIALSSLERYAEAEPLFRRSLEVLEAALEPDHPTRMAALETVGNFLRLVDRDAEADSLIALAQSLRAARSEGDSRD